MPGCVKGWSLPLAYDVVYSPIFFEACEDELSGVVIDASQALQIKHPKSAAGDLSVPRSTHDS